VITAVRTNAGVGAEVLEVNNLTALRALTPKSIALVRFLVDLDGGLSFAAISEPVKEGQRS
jgi:hypothetical protein